MAESVNLALENCMKACILFQFSISSMAQEVVQEVELKRD